MNVIQRRLVCAAVALAIAVALFTAYRMRTDPVRRAALPGEPGPTADEIRAIVEEGVIYGFPIVMNYGVLYEHSVNRSSDDFKAPFNAIHNEVRVFTAKDRSIVTPNSDTPYSTVMMDLRAEPVVLSAPAVETSRYFSVMLCDGNAFNYGYIGSRATGHEAGDYLVAGPDWQGTAPAGVRKVFRSSTQFSIALGRTQLFGPDDMENVKRVQAGLRVRTLSDYLGQPAPPPAPAADFPPFSKLRFLENFFDYLGFMLQFAPPGPEEKEIRAKLARIGIGSGQSFKFRQLTLRHKIDVAEGVKNATMKILTSSLSGSKRVNGWVNCDLFGDRAFYAGDWLKRAAAVGGGIYGNDAGEAVYFRAAALASGEALDGSAARYAITFPKGSLPPVHAFWSVTLYDARTFMLVDNPIDRYLINSAMLQGMKTNADGSLTLHISKDSPGPAAEANWLPARDGSFFLVLRLYWPMASVLDGSWSPPAIEKVK